MLLIIFQQCVATSSANAKVVLGLEDDPLGAGYNVRQSKNWHLFRGLFGKGFLNGTQTKLNYVSEQDTDFIFCTSGEEQGLWEYNWSCLLCCIDVHTHTHTYGWDGTTAVLSYLVG